MSEGLSQTFLWCLLDMVDQFLIMAFCNGVILFFLDLRSLSIFVLSIYWLRVIEHGFYLLLGNRIRDTNGIAFEVIMVRRLCVCWIHWLNLSLLNYSLLEGLESSMYGLRMEKIGLKGPPWFSSFDKMFLKASNSRFK